MLSLSVYKNKPTLPPLFPKSAHLILYFCVVLASNAPYLLICMHRTAVPQWQPPPKATPHKTSGDSLHLGTPEQLVPQPPGRSCWGFTSHRLLLPLEYMHWEAQGRQGNTAEADVGSRSVDVIHCYFRLKPVNSYSAWGKLEENITRRCCQRELYQNHQHITLHFAPLSYLSRRDDGCSRRHTVFIKQQMVQRLYATNFITFIKQPDGCLFLMLNTFQLKNLFTVLIMSSATVAYEEVKGVVGWLAVSLALTKTLKQIDRSEIIFMGMNQKHCRTGWFFMPETSTLHLP